MAQYNLISYDSKVVHERFKLNCIAYLAGVLYKN